MRAKWKLSKVPPGVVYDPVTRERDPKSDPKHLAQLRALACAVFAHPLPGATRCRLPVEAHHHTHGRGRGQKVSDRRSFSLCSLHHTEFHALSNTFKGWTKQQRRSWQDRMVAAYLAKTSSEKREVTCTKKRLSTAMKAASASSLSRSN